MEVLMATSILLGSVIVLNQLAAIGRKNAVSSQDLAMAQLLCESKMNELVAGILPADNVDEEMLEDSPGWNYSVAVTAHELPGLAQLTVSVHRDAAEGDRGETSKASRFTLVRWIPDSSEQHGMDATEVFRDGHGPTPDPGRGL
jgi:hypothetical protein